MQCLLSQSDPLVASYLYCYVKKIESLAIYTQIVRDMSCMFYLCGVHTCYKLTVST